MSMQDFVSTVIDPDIGWTTCVHTISSKYKAVLSRVSAMAVILVLNVMQGLLDGA